MAVRITLADSRDAARTVDALLAAAELNRWVNNPTLAARYVAIANSIADALEQSDVPPATDPDHFVDVAPGEAQLEEIGS